MSGGYFDYKNNLMYEWADKVNHEEFEELLRKVAELLHSYDLAVSGDTSMEDFVKKFKEFKGD